MLTVIDALDLLDECVRGQAAGRYSTDEAKAPGALLVSALSRGLPSPRELLQLPLVPEPRHQAATTGEEMVTIGALVALRTADRTQRSGACWTCSVAAARRAVVAYVDLLPERVLREATAERRTALSTTSRKTRSRKTRSVQDSLRLGLR